MAWNREFARAVMASNVFRVFVTEWKPSWTT